MHLTFQEIEKDEFFLKPALTNSDSINKLMLSIKEFINAHDCKNLVIDLHDQHFIYATQLGILTATYHFIKYIDGEVHILVDNNAVKNSIEKLNLSNATVTFEQGIFNNLIAI